MDNRRDLKEKLDAEIAALRGKCSDTEAFDKGIDRILSLKGQLDTEPVRVAVMEKDILKEAKGDTYWIAVTKTSAVFHAYGGYTVVADNRRCGALYMSIAGLADFLSDPDGVTDKEFRDRASVMERDKGKKLSKKELAELMEGTRKDIDTDFEAKLHVLSAPSWCFTDIVATYEIATTVVDTLKVVSENAENAELSEEDYEANADFEDAVRAEERLISLIDEDKEGAE